MPHKRLAVVMWVVLGFMLRGLSKAAEGLGDAAPYAAEGGVSGERLLWHVIALLLLLGAGACFVKVLVNLVRLFRAPARNDELARVFEDEPAPHASADPSRQFDAEAALARYMERQGPAQTAPPRGGFGRKGQ